MQQEEPLEGVFEMQLWDWNKCKTSRAETNGGEETAKKRKAEATTETKGFV